MIKISLQFFGGRGGGGSGGSRGSGRGGGGKASLTDERTLSSKDLALKQGRFMSSALMQAKDLANNLTNVGDYIEVTRTLKDGSVEVSRMTVTGTAKYNDVYSRSPKPSNPDVPSVKLTVPGWTTRTDSGLSQDVNLMNILLDKRTKTRSVTIRTYKKG